MAKALTKIKMCGIRRSIDTEYVNRILPDYIGYVFAPKSKRYVSPEQAAELTANLDKRIVPVGVFVDESIDNVIRLVKSGTIKIAQLHGNEDEDYIAQLHRENITVIKAFIIKGEENAAQAEKSPADHILLDSGMGSGKPFDYALLKNMKRPYFLAGGLDRKNAMDVVRELGPYALDVSSGIETDGFKDFGKMKEFMDSIY